MDGLEQAAVESRREYCRGTFGKYRLSLFATLRVRTVRARQPMVLVLQKNVWDDDSDSCTRLEEIGTDLCHRRQPAGPSSSGGSGSAGSPRQHKGEYARSREDAEDTGSANQQPRGPGNHSTDGKAILADKSLSTNAHNIKIITTDGIGHVEGSSKTEAEKKTIETKAIEVAGRAKVKRQISVTDSPSPHQKPSSKTDTESKPKGTSQ